MLIHVTRFQAVQRQVVAQVQEAMDALANSVRYGGKDDLTPFKSLWECEFEPVTEAFDQPDCPPVALGRPGSRAACHDQLDSRPRDQRQLGRRA